MKMSQCKTQADLHREFARVIDMCEGTGLNPIGGVKADGKKLSHVVSPCFISAPEDYTFAVGIVESKFVFPDDILYFGDSKLTVVGLTEYGELHCRDQLTASISCFDFNRLSWNPPKPTTVTICGHELPLPDGAEGYLFFGHKFKKIEDMHKWSDFVHACLRGETHD